MADVVRQLMEGMLPELQALVDKGIINADELRAIIKKREAFEYKLAKRSTELPDYIAAIKYEMLLQQLVKDRKAQLGIKKQHRLIDFGRQVARNKSVALCFSFHGGCALIFPSSKRIHFTFDRASKRFKGDVAVWREWITYCRCSSFP